MYPQKKGPLIVFIAIAGIAVVVVIGFASGKPKTSLTKTNNNAVVNVNSAAMQTPRSKVVTLTSPQNGETYERAEDIRITGDTAPNHYIQAYANLTETDMACLSTNTFSAAGADRADDNGHFDFAINYLGYRDGGNTLVVASLDEALKNTKGETCFPAFNVSDVQTYEFSSSDSKNDWQIYRNDVWDFSFQYPDDWTVTNDALPSSVETETSPDETLTMKYVTLRINPEGFGTGAPTKTFDVTMQSGGGLNVVNKETSPESEYRNDYYSIDVAWTDIASGKRFVFQFGTGKAQETNDKFDATVEKLLGTFQLIN